MIINCDIGERGADHPIDIELMAYIDLANIACGGHAGDKQSVDVFLKLAQRYDIAVSAHLSYPDIQNFGRFSMDIAFEELALSLDKQYALMPDVKVIKLHGALYNDANVDKKLAENLAAWFKTNNIRAVITPFDSLLAIESKKLGINVMPEAFAERRYTYDDKLNQLLLVNRSKDYASIYETEEAVKHARQIIIDKKIQAYNEVDGKLIIKEYPIEAQTICIHSDSPIALELVKALAKI